MAMRYLLLLGAFFFSYHSFAATWYEENLPYDPINSSKNSSLVQRDGKILSLKLSSGKHITLLNRESCETSNDCIYYWYRGLIAGKQFYWVTVGYYEGQTNLLISRKDGKQYDVIDEPHVSPNGNFVVSASAAEAYSPSGVFLWEIRNNSLIKRFFFEPPPTQLGLYRFSRWSNARIVELIKVTHAPDGFYSEDCPSSFSLIEFPVHLVFKQGRWKLDESMKNKELKCQQ
ncbi:MAG: hypothetical protein ACKVN9_03490 [Methylophilaceae bacterium]